MKKLVLLPALAVLAACGACSHDTSTADQICAERGFSKGTPAYDHCLVDERRAESLSRENKARMRK